MAEKHPTEQSEASQPHTDSSPRSSPRTDPTAPTQHGGEWAPADKGAERRIDEPGLEDEDRKQRL